MSIEKHKDEKQRKKKSSKNMKNIKKNEGKTINIRESNNCKMRIEELLTKKKVEKS